MNPDSYLEKNKSIQQNLLDYIDEGNEESYTKLIQNLTDLNIDTNQYELKSFLQLINSIAQNHHRTPDFFSRIEKILLHYQSIIKTLLSNKKIFDFQTLNKRLILFLLQQKIVSIKNFKLESNYFKAYFYPEMKGKLSHQVKQELERKFPELQEYIDPEKFNQYRQIGENPSYICTLIRNDSVQDFISHVNKYNISLSNTTISQSIFETNPALYDKKGESQYKRSKLPTLIEYASFYGSIQIIQYMKMNNVKLTPKLWRYVIHSNQPELIHFLEENQVEYANPIHDQKKSESLLPFMNKKQFIFNKGLRKILIESIKCHQNDFFIYLKDNLSAEIDKNAAGKNDQIFVVDIDDGIRPAIFEFHNYFCFPEEIINPISFYYLCAYDYLNFVKLFLQIKDFNINEKLIHYIKLNTIHKEKLF